MRPECPVTEDDIQSLVDEELPGRKQRQVAAHVIGCSRCSQAVGAQLAGKRLLGASGQEVDVPAGSWERVLAEMDLVDGVAKCAVGERPDRRRLTMPSLAAAGLLLAFAVWGWQARSAPPPGSAALFARAHEAAWREFAPIGSAGDPSAWADVSEVTTPRPDGIRWVPVARALIPLDGEIVEQSLYRVDRTPVSEFVLPSHSFSANGFVDVNVKGAHFLCRTERGGLWSLVAWQSDRVTNVLVGRTRVEELLVLAASRRACTPLLRSL